MCFTPSDGALCEIMVQHMQNIDRTAAAFYAPREASDSIGPVGYIGPGGSERLKGFITSGLTLRKRCGAPSGSRSTESR